MQRAIAGRAAALVNAFKQDPGSGTAVLNLVVPADVAQPEYVRTAAKAALDAGATHYTARPGVTELRTAIAERSTAWGFPAIAGRVIVTNGASEALYIVAQSLFKAGSPVLISGPITPAVLEMIAFIGAIPVAGDAAPENGFFGSVDAFASTDAPAVLISSPSPVTGLALSDHELRDRIAAALESGKQVVLDRSLETARLDGHPSVFSDSALGDRIVTIGSFSTGHGLRGWRVGWLTAPESTLSTLASLKQALSICTTAVSQYAALAALQQGDEFLEERRDDFAGRLREVTGLLDGAGVSYLPPVAYPSLLIEIPDVAQQAQIADEGIVVDTVAGLFAQADSYLRIDLGVERSTLIAGVTSIAAIAGGRS
jgi:aspartate aminotransferase